MTQRRKIQMKISTCDKSDSSLSKYVSTKVNMSLILNNHSGSKQVATRVWSFEGRQRSGLREGVEEIRDQGRWQRQTANDGHRREDQTNVPRGARNFIPRLPQVEDRIGDTLFFLRPRPLIMFLNSGHRWWFDRNLEWVVQFHRRRRRATNCKGNDPRSSL